MHQTMPSPDDQGRDPSDFQPGQFYLGKSAQEPPPAFTYAPPIPSLIERIRAAALKPAHDLTLPELINVLGDVEAAGRIYTMAKQAKEQQAWRDDRGYLVQKELNRCDFERWRRAPDDDRIKADDLQP